MRNRPGVGDQVVHQVTVTDEMTARLFGREIHPVYGTAWMVRHVEEAGRLLVEPLLGPDEDATGYEIHLVHERPAAVGDQLSITARVTHADKRTCRMEAEVLGPAGLVGAGWFVQRYVPRGHLNPGGKP
jgi:fluoroacetyl-CoA thioesterase